METLNLQPPTMEWRVYRNDNTSMTLALVDSNNAPLDLTNWNFTGKVREFPSDATALSQLTITKTANTLSVVLDTADLTLMSYFDIEGINSVSSVVSTIIRGQIFVEEDITR